MDNIVFPMFSIGELSPGDWIRTAEGEVGIIHDKIDQPGYRKASVEVPGSRHPIRILPFEVQVEHVTDRKSLRS